MDIMGLLHLELSSHRRVSAVLSTRLLGKRGPTEFFYTLSINKRIRNSISVPVARQTDARILYSGHITSSSSDTRTTLLLLGRRDRLIKVEIGFGVCELLHPFDFQAPVLIGNDIYDEDRFAVHLNSD
jgi:hypothetical protein